MGPGDIPFSLRKSFVDNLWPGLLTGGAVEEEIEEVDSLRGHPARVRVVVVVFLGSVADCAFGARGFVRGGCG